MSRCGGFLQGQAGAAPGRGACRLTGAAPQCRSLQYCSGLTLRLAGSGGDPACQVAAPAASAQRMNAGRVGLPRLPAARPLPRRGGLRAPAMHASMCAQRGGRKPEGQLTHPGAPAAGVAIGSSAQTAAGTGCCGAAKLMPACQLDLCPDPASAPCAGHHRRWSRAAVNGRISPPSPHSPIAAVGISTQCQQQSGQQAAQQPSAGGSHGGAAVGSQSGLHRGPGLLGRRWGGERLLTSQRGRDTITNGDKMN